jgi:hypothetical protein
MKAKEVVITSMDSFDQLENLQRRQVAEAGVSGK